jgi:hypothetical protein
MSTTKKIANTIPGDPISLQEAMNRTNYWREAVKGLFGDDYAALPRGFYIPIADIQALAENFKEKNVTGVRAYFTLLQPGPPYTDAVRGILVPVVEESDGQKVVYKDLIIPVKSGQDEPADGGDVSIYDLTRPCPAFCDLTSPLY